MKAKKTSLVIIISILIIIIIIVFALPRIFSSKAGKNFLIKRIEHASNAEVTIGSFNLTWFGPQSIKNLNYKDQNLDMQVDSITSNMSLLSFYKSIKSYKKLKFITNTEVENLNVNFHFPSLPRANISNVNASIKADAKGLNSIYITGKTQEDNKTGSFNAQINFYLDKINAKIVGTGIPTVAIDQLLFRNNKKYQNILVQLLGPSIDVEINSVLDNLTGPIDINYSSSNSNGKLNLFYEKDKITLKENATIILTLAGMNPTFIKGINYIQSQPNHPIILRISKDGFTLPLPFNLKDLKVKHAALDLNKMVVSNIGVIRSITNIAKMPSSRAVSMWFTYVNLQLENGMLYSDRMDVLIDNDVHFCLWGKINLLSESLKMYLGITADTLHTVFGIQNLPDDYVIKIPIKGSFENPKIDASSATAKILALSTLQTGKGIGSIIGGVITKFQKDDDIPEAKRPFPWEGKVRRRSRSNQIDLDNIFDLFR